MNQQERDFSPSTIDAWRRADFEFAAALKDATGDGTGERAPAGLMRPVPWRRSLALFGSATALALACGWAFMQFVYPPELVREALVHEYREATLRGDFQPDKAPLMQALGRPAGATLPGLLQLQRPCDIDGRKAYHVTTFMEKGGGIVTILAFEQPLSALPRGEGRWLGRHWRFVQAPSGNTILLLADNAKVLAETEQLLLRG